jgi:hypothetical protein
MATALNRRRELRNVKFMSFSRELQVGMEILPESYGDPL